MTAHTHAALMLQYAQDATETETPWLLWQFLEPGATQWEDLCNSCMWTPEYQYRRKPKVILINGIAVPEPMRVAPELGSRYWSPSITGFDPLSDSTLWYDKSIDHVYLERGFCHSTEDAAELHTKALLSFTRSDK